MNTETSSIRTTMLKEREYNKIFNTHNDELQIGTLKGYIYNKGDNEDKWEELGDDEDEENDDHDERKELGDDEDDEFEEEGDGNYDDDLEEDNEDEIEEEDDDD